MELALKGALFRVDTSRVATTCDECRMRHRSCSREEPACMRCRELGIACTRLGARVGRFASCLVRAGWSLDAKHAAPVTWAQAIEIHSKDWYTQYFMRRYLLPLAPLLPKPTDATRIDRMRFKALKLSNYAEARDAQPHFDYPAEAMRRILGRATEAFFRQFNPFFPLFSEDGFCSKPRSRTLRKIVTQIGLETMQANDLTRAAIHTTNITPEDLRALPISVDTLQCHLLVYFGIWTPSIRKHRMNFLRCTERLFPLLGLHLPSRCLERTLAVQMFYYAFHHMSIAQTVVQAKYSWFEEAHDHTHPSFLQGRLDHLGDAGALIHFVASTCAYHSFDIVVNAHKDYTHALAAGTSAVSFARALTRQTKALEANFRWGWDHLACLVIPKRHTPLLFQSRLTLALRYHNNFLELMKLGLHIPADLRARVLAAPLASRITAYSHRVLVVAIRNIRLASTINAHFFDSDFIYLTIPSIAFLMCHCRVAVAGPLEEALALARACLKKAQSISFFKESATCYLELFDYLVKRNQIALEPAL